MLTLINLVSSIIPIKTLRRTFRNRLTTKFIQKNQNKKAKHLKEKILKNQKITVAFLVVFDSVFPSKVIFEKMLNDELFEPKILVIPDTSRGSENQFYQLNKTYRTLVNTFGNNYVINTFDNNKFVDYINRFDMAFFSNPYDAMTDKNYTIEHYAKNGVLPLYINYGTMPDYYARNYIITLNSLNLCWKIFADTALNFEDIKKYTKTKGYNAVLSGYCKMDKLYNIHEKVLKRKKIIIAPHHTVNMPHFPLSNFLEYHDFFIWLFERYPYIDFVFRPHPLLFVTLSRNELWGKEKVQEYIKKITSFPNVEYQDGGDYLETFVNSSAMIHDCSSFVMEYLYTGHPVCYMLKSKDEIKEIFVPIGQQCLSHHYQAFNKEEIISFIENIVLAENDYMEQQRKNFAEKNIMLNYPNVADFIIKNIKESLV